MARCDYCNTYILFGGKTHGDLRFCNDTCLEHGHVIRRANDLDDDLVADALEEAHQGPCPKCNGEGPVDVHTKHSVWSAVYLTSWNGTPVVCCRSCGRKSQLGAMVFSGLLGWWGFPWGIIMTPVQIGRNLSAIFGGPDPHRPSAQLEQLVRIEVVMRMDAGESPTRPKARGKSRPKIEHDEEEDYEVVTPARKSAPKPVAKSKPAASSAADEMIVVNCEECSATLKAKPSFAGKRVKCPKCGSPIKVPDPLESAADYFADDE